MNMQYIRVATNGTALLVKPSKTPYAMKRRFFIFQNDVCYEIAIEILTPRFGNMGS
jgi:hypothetical protein